MRLISDEPIEIVTDSSAMSIASPAAVIAIVSQNRRLGFQLELYLQFL